MDSFDEDRFQHLFDLARIDTVLACKPGGQVVFTRREEQTVDIVSHAVESEPEVIESGLPSESAIAYDEPTDSILLYDPENTAVQRIGMSGGGWRTAHHSVPPNGGDPIGVLRDQIILLTGDEEEMRLVSVPESGEANEIYRTHDQIGDHHGDILYRNGATTASSFVAIDRDDEALLFVEIDEGSRECAVVRCDFSTGSTDQLLTSNNCYYHIPWIDIFPEEGQLYVSHLRGGEVIVSRLDLDAGELTPVVQCGDVVSFEISDETLSYSVKQPGSPHVRLYEAPIGERPSLVASQGVNHPVGGTEECLIFRSSDWYTSPSYYRYDRTDGTQSELHVEIAEHTKHSQYSVDLVTSPFDERLYGFLYVPNSISAYETYPLMVWIHGGPSERHVAEFDPILTWLVSQDILVFAPTYPGTTKQGLSFFEEAKGNNLGDREVEALRSLLGVVSNRDQVDPERLIVAGASYGGYLALLFLSRTDLFQRGIVCSGIADWEYQLEYTNQPEYDHWLLFGEGTYSSTRTHEKSPIHNLDQISVPLYITHGKQDQSVPFGQIRALTSFRSTPALETCFSPNGSHGLGSFEDNERLDWGRRFVDFLSDI